MSIAALEKWQLSCDSPVVFRDYGLLDPTPKREIFDLIKFSPDVIPLWLRDEWLPIAVLAELQIAIDAFFSVWEPNFDISEAQSVARTPVPKDKPHDLEKGP